jgi:nucleoside-triphosphatase THEP1
MSRRPTKAFNIRILSGPVQSGKTTAAQNLLTRARANGRSVAGILAPSIRLDGRLIGFEVVDVASGRRTRLATRSPGDVHPPLPFEFHDEGLELGASALTCDEAMKADLVVVDEFGPLELSGRGWRGPVDALAKRAAGLILLVVRQSLVARVLALYGLPDDRVTDMSNPARAVESALAALG